MAVTIDDLNKPKRDLNERVLIYGPPGTGKNTLALEWPDPVFLEVEDGMPDGKKPPSFGLLKSYDAVEQAILVLYNENTPFKTVVLDTADKMEPLVWEKTCQKHGWDSIEAPGYGRGYVEADKVWRDLLDGLMALRRDKGMSVLILAHSHIVQFPNPAGAQYPRWDIRLHKRGLALIQDEMDVILMINQEATLTEEKGTFGKGRMTAAGGEARYIFCDGRSERVAKNRYGLPPKLHYVKGQGYAKLAPKLPSGRNHAAAASSEAA